MAQTPHGRPEPQPHQESAAPGAARSDAITVRPKPAPEGMVPQTVTNFLLLEAGGDIFITLMRVVPPLLLPGDPQPREIQADVVAQVVFSTPRFAEFLHGSLETLQARQPQIVDAILETLRAPERHSVE